jgi:hypothetical protein
MIVDPMKKIVINSCYGGFSLSPDAIKRYAELAGLNLITVEDEGWPNNTLFYEDEVKDENYFSDRSIDRTDPILIQVVEEFGERADGFCARLKIVEIPDDVKWHIDEYDGKEHIAEDHRTWY